VKVEWNALGCWHHHERNAQMIGAGAGGDEVDGQGSWWVPRPSRSLWRWFW
jgi:hypothetical protein